MHWLPCCAKVRPPPERPIPWWVRVADARDATPQRIDLDLLAQRPLPKIAQEADKNSRGRVCVLGGSAQVPGGAALTAEAALRAGAGKVRIGTIAPAAVTVGLPGARSRRAGPVHQPGRRSPLSQRSRESFSMLRHCYAWSATESALARRR
nr:NAD(P)H-hydrate dehydratase [Novosphingobium sp. SG720]